MASILRTPFLTARSLEGRAVYANLATSSRRSISHAVPWQRESCSSQPGNLHKPVKNPIRSKYFKLSTNRNQARSLSSTASRATTIVTANPRQDEDGNDMLLEITTRAAKRLGEIMTNDTNPDLALRVSVESGGCHGFQYLMSLTTAKELSPEDDTVFEADDGSGAKVVIDEPSLELLKGSQVDYTMELIGSQFKIVGNPAASSSCGCGTSFDIKP